MARIIYSRGFPYGAPLVLLRGGATKLPEVKELLKKHGFRWEGRPTFAWTSYANRKPFGEFLRKLRDEHGLEVVPKEGMDENYIIDLDDPEFGRPGILDYPHLGWSNKREV